MKKSAFLLIAAFLLAGCGKQADKAPASGQSGSAGVIDTMTQKSKVDAGRRTADKVREISAQQNADLQEVSGE